MSDYNNKVKTQFFDAFPLCFPKPPYYGFYVGEGWWPIIKELCSNIESILSELPEKKFCVEQVKEKFGGLRFYVTHIKDSEANEKIDSLIKEAESKCYKICEECGNAGTIRGKGWVKVRCDCCEEKYNNKKK